MTTITLSGKMLGKRRSLFPDAHIPIPPDFVGGGRIVTLRDLLTYLVQQEVEAYTERNESRRLEQVLSKARIDTSAAQGKVNAEPRQAEPVDVDAAIATALSTFEDGFYFVFIDDHQQEDLDAEVALQKDSRVLFVRLTPLVGG